MDTKRKPAIMITFRYTFVSRGRLDRCTVVWNRLSRSSFSRPSASKKLPDSEPSFAAGPLGVTYLVYNQVSSEGAIFGGEIHLSTNPGGSFGAPINLSDNRIDDYAPNIVLARKRAARSRAPAQHLQERGAPTERLP